MPTTQEQEQSKLKMEFISSAILNKEIPKFYFNGFSNGIGNSDIVIVLQLNNTPIAVLNTSYTIAKTLSKKLDEMIQNLETASGNSIMTTDDVNKYLTEAK